MLRFTILRFSSHEIHDIDIIFDDATFFFFCLLMFEIPNLCHSLSDHRTTASTHDSQCAAIGTHWLRFSCYHLDLYMRNNKDGVEN